MKPSCNWITSLPGEFPSRKCGAAVKLRYVLDDDSNRVRQYDNLCEEHQIAAKRQEELYGNDI